MSSIAALEVKTRTRTFFFGLWAFATLVVGSQVLQGRHTFDAAGTPFILVLMLVLSLALTRWLRNPIPAEPGGGVVTRPGDAVTRRGRFILRVVAMLIALFCLATFLGPPLLFVLPVVAVLVLALLGAPLKRKEIAYALALALIAGVTGLGAGWIRDFSLQAWAALQFALVLAGLLAGWGLLAHTGLAVWGIGSSLFLAGGAGAALRGFAEGMLMGTPWALSIVLLGGSNDDRWVHAWWQPLAALQPGISEEAWGRVLLIPLCFLVLRRVARPKTALSGAAIIMAYWFAYLHTARDLSPSAIINTLMIGTLYALPVSYVWLRRGLEPAIGFHFWQDFVRFAAAYLLNAGFFPF